MSEYGRQFNEEDPTISLWKRLLPGPRKKRGPMSEAEKKRRAKSLRLYYLEHPNPQQGLYPNRDSNEEDGNG